MMYEDGQRSAVNARALRKTYIAPIIIFILSGIAIATYAYTSRSASTLPLIRFPTARSCGTSPAEARSNGCRFDVTSFSWLPLACYDESIVAEFLAAEPWEWFMDPSGTRSVALDAVKEGEVAQMYVSWRYHLSHCVFMWRKMHKAVISGRVVDAYVGNYNHTIHCGHMLMAEDKASNILNTIIRRKFIGCGVDEVITA